MNASSASAPYNSPARPNARILQISDFHFLAEPDGTLLGVNTEQSFRDVIEALTPRLATTDLIMATGDLAQDACAGSYRRIAAALDSLGPDCYCLPGNHDENLAMQPHLNQGRLHCQDQILIGNWQIVCLDSSIPDDPRGFLADSELRRLDARLEEHPDRHALIALHHHPFPSGSRWMDTMVLQNAAAFSDIVHRYPKARTIICGHVHQDLEIWSDGLRLLTCPSTCFQFLPKQADFSLDRIAPGYRWLDLYEDGSLATGVERAARLPTGLDLNSAGY